MGKIEIRDSYSTFHSGDEGRELFWRTTSDFNDVSLEVIDSPDTPLNIPNFSSNTIDVKIQLAIWLPLTSHSMK